MSNAPHNLTLVAGDADFIGFHLCNRLLDEGHDVLCLDNLQTARPRNLDMLDRRSGFTFVEADVTEPFRAP